MSETINPDIFLKPTEIVIQSAKTEITPQQQQSMDSLKNFFSINTQIKEALLNACPPQTGEPDYGNFFRYNTHKKKLSSNLEEINTLFRSLSENMSTLGLSGQDILKQSEKISKNTSIAISINPRWEYDGLSQIYQNNFAKMKPKLVQEISNKIIGYFDFKYTEYSKILSQVESFNELLHLAHATASNDENLFTKLPQWGHSNGEPQFNFGAYGEETENSRKIFDYIKEQSISSYDSDRIEIFHLLSTKNLIQIMIRDYGHALTIEIDTSDSTNALIRYNVPKIFDGKKVRLLPGINLSTVNPDRRSNQSASGKFETTYDNLAQKIFGFILRVPTDANH